MPSHAQRAGIKSTPFDVVEATIPEIHAAMKAGKLTARQLIQSYLDRITAYDKKGPDLNCIITLNSEALADADKLDAEFKKTGKFTGSMHGIAVLVKNEIDIAGMPTTLGSAVFKDYRPTLDAFVIAELRKQGAIILGKTTLGEFAAGDTYGSGRGCGAPVTWGRNYCGSCGVVFAKGELIRAAKRGRIVAQSPEAQASRAETQRRNAQAQLAWKPSDLPDWLTENVYATDIHPRLSGVTVSALASSIGVSKPYAADIRAGRRRPHQRHWQALGQLVSVFAADS